jgi:hypothetical protein
VLVEPGLDALLDVSARVAQLGQLDEVLELQVVDVIDQGATAPTGAPLLQESVPVVPSQDARGGIRTRMPRRTMDFESIA